MAGSPTQRTLKLFRKRGYPLIQVVEHYNAQAMRRIDLFSCLDILAVTAEGETIGVQVTSDSNLSARVHKITDSPALAILRLAGWRVLCHGWKKGKNGRYVLREVDLS